MKSLFFKKYPQSLLQKTLIACIIAAVSLPLISGITHAEKIHAPNHTLTYTQGRLTWDSKTGINTNGVAEIDLFDAEYESVEDSEGENVVAPGTEGLNTIRLKNSVSKNVNYTAVLYSIRTNEMLPVAVALSGENFVEAKEYLLPEGVSEDQVIRAVTGSLSGEDVQDFDVSWFWEYYESDKQDIIDTTLGNRQPADDIIVGMYIVVEDGNEYIKPSNPKTGDTSNISAYLAILLTSVLVMIFLILERFREKKCEKY